MSRILTKNNNEFFYSTWELLRQYQRRLFTLKQLQAKSAFLEEAVTIIDQLDFALTKVHSLEERYRNIKWPIFDLLVEQTRPIEQDLEQEDICFQMQFYCEAFYYMAYRLRAILCRHNHLPGLEQFKGQAVADVRDKLIFHPEDPKSQNFQQSFKFGGKEGPILKAHFSKTFRDSGLYLNAKEFKDELELLLRNFFEKNRENGDTATEKTSQ